VVLNVTGYKVEKVKYKSVIGKPAAKKGVNNFRMVRGTLGAFFW
jgi:hypothetical protein